MRGGYEELEVAEITHWLEQHPGAYDVVLSADTLVYFGELLAVLRASRSALRRGGWVGFTLEAYLGDESAFELAPSGRYRHTRAYVEQTLGNAGFGEVMIRPDTLRKESGRPVDGWVVLGQRKDD